MTDRAWRLNLENEDWIIINPATEDKQDDLIATTGALAQTITNAIDETAFDLNAGAFSETTNIIKAYKISKLVLNFSIADAKTITVTWPDGTILAWWDVDTSSSNLYYNTTKTDFVINEIVGMGFDANDNITVTVTQFSSAGTMDCVLSVESGTNTLLWNPVVYGEDLVAGGNYPLPLDRNGIAVPVIDSDHSRIHKWQGYSASNKFTGLNTGDSFDILLRNPAFNFPHLRVFEFDSDKSPWDIMLYEAPSTTDDGIAIIFNNLSRNSSNTPDLLGFTEPTVTNAWTQLEFHLITWTKASGGSSQGAVTERNLKTDTDYLVRFTAGANGTTIGWYLFFYEW